jgi:uncharacterized protein YecT (DUF1311 family)
VRNLGLAVLGLTTLAPAPAAAFNCAKATTEVEKEICANGEALGANDRMEKTYFGLREKLSDAGRKVLLDGQKAWLGWRDTSCGPVAECLIEQNNARAEELEQTPPGMAPFMLLQKGVPNGYEVNISGYRFIDPSNATERTYNSWIDAAIGKTPYGEPPPSEERPLSPWSHEVDFELSRIDGKLISLTAYTYDFSGGAHPNSWSTSINLDRATGSAVEAETVFGTANLAMLTNDCQGQIIDWHSDRYGDLAREEALRQLEEEFPGGVAKHIGDMSRWHFDKDGGVIRFDSYAIAPYAAGPAECRFSYAALRDLAVDASFFATAE